MRTAVRTVALSLTYHRIEDTSVYRFRRALSGKAGALKRFPLPLLPVKKAVVMLYDGLTAIASEDRTELKRRKSALDLYYRIIQLQLTLKLAGLGYDKGRELKKLTGFDSPNAAEGILKKWVDQHNEHAHEQGRESEAVNHAERINELLMELSAFQGYELNERKATVLAFALAMKRYRKDLEEKKKQAERLKHKV
jgi:hypothetical protein